MYWPLVLSLHCLCLIVKLTVSLLCRPPQFHLTCVGLNEAPKDDWWCPDCRKLLPETAMKRSASQPGDKKKKKRRRIFS